MIYDCFIYFDEDVVTDIRFNVLNDYVDYFVVVESSNTHRGSKKKINFSIDNFKEFKDKIIYILVDDLPINTDPWVLENFQRNCISRGINNCDENDIIIISDVDEIPNPETIKNFNLKNKFAIFKQKFFYYKLNLLSVNEPDWYGSRICLKRYLKSPQWLRNFKSKKYPSWRIDKSKVHIIEDGGWHFSFLKSPENISKKLTSYAHKEFSGVEFSDINIIKKKVEKYEDLFDANKKYKKVSLDSSFPEYILKNTKKFSNWIV